MVTASLTTGGSPSASINGPSVGVGGGSNGGGLGSNRRGRNSVMKENSNNMIHLHASISTETALRLAYVTMMVIAIAIVGLFASWANNGTPNRHAGDMTEGNLRSLMHTTSSDSTSWTDASTPSVGKGPIVTVNMPSKVRQALTEELVHLQLNDKESVMELQDFLSDAKSIVMEEWLKDRPDILKLLSDLLDPSSPVSALFFPHTPIDPVVPRTPTDGSVSLHKTQSYIGEAMLTAMGELAGSSVVGYKAETAYSNPWIHEGYPRNSKGSALTSASGLSFHQDMSYHPYVPDILGLYCLREGYDTEVQTTLLDIQELIKTLPKRVVDVLMSPRFEIKTSDWVDASLLGGGQGAGSSSKEDDGHKGRPLIEDTTHSLHLPVHWENMVGLDEEAKEAVEVLKRAITKASPHNVHFRDGDLLLFSNQRMVHARTSYTDLRFDGGDRVMLRSYFVSNAVIRSHLTAAEQRERML